jgi:hypothetical protein
MLSGRVDIGRGREEANDIARYFGVRVDGSACPTIVMIPRGVPVSDINKV